jgi:hypothetical protein
MQLTGRNALSALNPVKAPERARERVLSLEELRAIWTATWG